MKTTIAEQVTRGVARKTVSPQVLWYLGYDREQHDGLHALALMELVILGVAMRDREDFAECAKCGGMKLIHRFDEEGKNVCEGCDS